MAAKSVQTATAKEAARSARKQTMNESITEEGGATAAMTELFAEAETQVESTGTVDDIWFTDAAQTVVEAVLRGGSERASVFERHVAVLDALLRRKGKPGPGRETVLAQTSLLQRIAQVAAQAVVPAEVARSIEPGSHAARTLARLDGEKEVFSDALVEDLHLHQSELSRVFRRLSELGLVQRRKYGRRASWSLTTAGTMVLTQLRERDAKETGQAPTDLVIAASPEEFEDAVTHHAEAIEIDRPSGEATWYLRATFDRMTGEQVFGTERLPFVVFPTLTDYAAYVRGDFARTLDRYLKFTSHPSDGLMMVVDPPISETDEEAVCDVDTTAEAPS